MRRKHCPVVMFLQTSSKPTRNLDERDRENGVISEYQRGTEGGGQDQQPDIPGGGQVQGLRGQQAGRLGGRGPGQSR